MEASDFGTPAAQRILGRPTARFYNIAISITIGITGGWMQRPLHAARILRAR